MGAIIFFLSISILIYLVFFVYSLVYPISPIYHFLLPGILFLIAHLIGASVAVFIIGLNSLRGKLFFGMASGYLFFAIGILIYLFMKNEILFYISFYIAYLFMIAYVFYEAFEYTRRGLTLDFSDILQITTISTLIVIFIILIVSYTYKLDGRLFFNVVLIFLGFLLTLALLPPVFMHWGGSIGFEWLLIAIGSFILLLSNILFISYLSTLNLIFLKIASSLWSIVGLGGIGAFIFGEIR